MGNDDVNLKEWVIVSSPAGRYLGRPSGRHVQMDITDGGVTVSSSVVRPIDADNMKREVLEAVSHGDCVEFALVFDFMAPLRQVQAPNGKPAMVRDPIITPPDFTVEAMPLYVKATAVYFCGDMKETDQKTYKELVEGALRTALAARAQASGIHLAGTKPAPTNLRGV